MFKGTILAETQFLSLIGAFSAVFDALRPKILQFTSLSVLEKEISEYLQEVL